MNFLYVSESQHPILGGASKCIYTLFANLVKKGHTCYTLGYNAENVFDVQGITVIHTTNLQGIFIKLLQENIDIVVTQLQGIEWVVDLCNKYKVPVILRIPSFEYVCANSDKMRTCNFICTKNQNCKFKGDLFKVFR
jgi:formyltetrahydrofolate synthetase